MYTPDGVTLQDRTTGAVRGTITQYRQGKCYMWLYTSEGNPKTTAYVTHVWVIDPMPESDALTLARKAYKSDTVETRFNRYCTNDGVRNITRMITGKLKNNQIFAEEAIRKVFDSTEEAYIAYQEAVIPVINDLKERLGEEFSQASDQLATVPPLGDSSYAPWYGMGYATAVGNVLSEKAPTRLIPAYAGNTSTG